MKTRFFPSKKYLKFNTGVCLFFVVFALFLQSCGTESGYLQCSIDGNRQIASGPSYPQESPTATGYAGNVALIFLGAQEDPRAYRDQRNLNHGTFNFQPQNNFYAATNLDPASLAFSNGQGTVQQNTTQKPYDFVSHLNYMGGIELVQKRSGDDGLHTTLNYFEIPVYGIYQHYLSSGTIFGGLGPYIAYGIGGSNKDSFNGKTTSSPAFNSTSGFKRFDAGLGLTAGYRLPNSFYFNLAYEWGIANIQNNAFGDKTRNRSISLNVGYPISRIIKPGKK